MPRRVKVTLTTDHSETFLVDDEYVLDLPGADDPWLEIEKADGGIFAVPARLVVGITIEGKEEPKPRARRRKAV